MSDKWQFQRINRLPPYVFNIVTGLKQQARARGEDIIDFGMGNPDQPTPPHIVDKLIKVVKEDPKTHRYSVSRGIGNLRTAVCNWYRRKCNVDLDPETEAIVTIGSKEGISHLVLAIVGPGDAVIVPSPTYPIHTYSVFIANGDVISVPLTGDTNGEGFFESLKHAYERTWPRPKALILNFPHNPTTAVVDIAFFEQVIDFALSRDLIVIHDYAYADIVFDGYRAPSILEVPRAKEVAVEMFTLSKSYNMPGWRVGFVVGNEQIIYALSRLKSYFDYGMFAPIQIASITALNDPRGCVDQICEMYRDRRDTLVEGLNRIGWECTKPKASMFIWARIPEKFRAMGSLEFSKMLIRDAKVAVAPGIGFGEGGDEYVRFALVENEHRTKQALAGMKKVLGK